MLGPVGRIAAAALVAAACVGIAEARTVSRRAVRARSVLEGDAEFRAKGSVSALHKFATARRDERFVLALRLKRLNNGEEYSLWGQDPDDELGVIIPMPPYTLTAKNKRATVTYDSAVGPLPFDSTLDALGGMLVQVRNAEGTVVLAGRIPELPTND